MKVLISLGPVIVMILLGYAARTMHWISKEQEEGLKSVLFGILLPVMVFHAVFTTQFELSYAWIILFTFAAHIVSLLIGYVLRKPLGDNYSHVTPVLHGTFDGGNAAYPLYIALVGAQLLGNIVILDISNIFVVYLVIPVFVGMIGERSDSDLKGMLKDIFSNPTVIGMFIGLILSLTGVYTRLSTTAFGALYDSAMNAITSPLGPLILFTIGYDFSVKKDGIQPLLKCLGARVTTMICFIVLFRILFASFVADPNKLAAVILYFLCPPAFVMPMLAKSLFHEEADGGFISAFISMNLAVTIVVFAFVSACIL